MSALNRLRGHGRHGEDENERDADDDWGTDEQCSAGYSTNVLVDYCGQDKLLRRGSRRSLFADGFDLCRCCCAVTWAGGGWPVGRVVVMGWARVGR